MATFARLHKQFTPSQYDVFVACDKNTMTFHGSIRIIGDVTQPSTVIRLHAKELTVRRADVDGVPADVRIVADDDEVQLAMPTSIQGTCEIRIEFDGAITKPMHGLYPCFAKNGDILLATQFESHHAREVFPCIDEPAAKARFNVQLEHDAAETALSNMPVKDRQATGNGHIITTFDTTPLMSTYLLAFVIGNMHSVQGRTKNGTEINIWSSVDQPTTSLLFALDTAIQATEFFNDYFDTAYPLPKCDHVALPDFSAGAMENWGLVTYREFCLLVDPSTTSQSTKEYVATVIAHEISHQWFGNLVTMLWWDDLWLNESFATLMEYIAVDAIHPDWNIMLDFASQDALSALWRDQLEGVQAVKTDVGHPDEISTLFDGSIVYAKGARLLNMVWTYVGDTSFRQGLKRYFEQHAYGNTTGADLWNALSEVSGKDVGRFMDDWLSTSNYPILTAKRSGDSIDLSQARFTSTGIKESTSRILPLSPEPKLAIDELTASSQSIKSDDFVQFNTSGGHFTVRYQPKAYRDWLAGEAAAGRVEPIPRLLLLNDYLMQSRAGLTHIDAPLDLVRAYRHEQLEPVWNVISLVIGDAKRLSETSTLREKKLKAIVGDLTREHYARLGWQRAKHESNNDTKLRETILSLALYSEQADVVQAALDRFAPLHELPAESRAIVLSASVRHGGRFDAMLELYPTITDPEMQQDVAGALCATHKVADAKKLLDKLTDESYIRLQDVDRFVAYLLRNKKTRQAAWTWLTHSWEWIEANFSSDKSYDHFPRYAASAFSAADELDQFQTFFDSLRNRPALARAIDLGQKEIAARVAWRKREEARFASWLKSQPISPAK